MNFTRTLRGAALAASVALGSSLMPMAAAAAPAAVPAAAPHAAPDFAVFDQSTLARGAIVALRGTPHLWIADEQGILHWSGDTRALAGRTVDWGNRTEVSLEQLTSMQRGDPWLSAGLLKDGDPIYFVKWETEWAQPQLLHIQSIKDVELFGINSSNYGQFVLDRSQWEQRYGISAASLTRGTLSSATGTTSTAGTSTTTSTTSTTTTTTAGSTRGVLARALSAQEKTAFFESTLSISSSRRVYKWGEPIKVELRKSTYSTQQDVINGVISEVSGLLSGHSISRVASGGNIVIDFVPLTQIEGGLDGVLGYAEMSGNRDYTLRSCVITVAHDPEAFLGSDARYLSPQQKTDLLSLVVRHEFGHCLGLGHNNSESSYMSYNFNVWKNFAQGGRTSAYNDFDKAIIRTLYHSAVRPGMSESDLGELFAG